MPNQEQQQTVYTKKTNSNQFSLPCTLNAYFGQHRQPYEKKIVFCFSFCVNYKLFTLNNFKVCTIFWPIGENVKFCTIFLNWCFHLNDSHHIRFPLISFFFKGFTVVFQKQIFLQKKVLYLKNFWQGKEFVFLSKITVNPSSKKKQNYLNL